MVADVAYLEQSLQRSQQQLSQLESSFARQRQAFKANPMPSAEQRIQWLNVLRDLLSNQRDALISAISQDFSNRSADETLLAELMPSLHGIHYATKRIKKWMKPSRRSVGMQFMPASAKVIYQPLGVVGVIVPWNYPLFLAIGPLVGALAAGNRVMIKMSESTPATSQLVKDLLAKVFPEDLVTVVLGEAEVGMAFSKLPFDHLLFTGATSIGKHVMRAAAENLTPVTLELGGKSPNIFFSDIMDADDAFFDKTLEGFAMFALNQGEVCTCPSRALIQEDIYDAFIERAIDRVGKIKQGNPLDETTMIGAQASKQQFDKINSYLEIGRAEGAKVLTGGSANSFGGDLSSGYYIQPTIFEGNNKMRVFQEEIFGPVVSVTTFKDLDDAIEIANDTVFGLGAGVWSRDMNTAYRAGRGIEAGRVWTNCYHAYPAGAAFGGYKQSGIGRETHKMMLDHYQQTKNLLVSYNPNKLGFF